MRDRPYRTGTTWLTDDQLVLLDVLFDRGSALQSLRREGFLEQFNLGYTHDLEDAALECNLRWLCEHSVLEPRRDRKYMCFQMTPDGGALWSRERCPVWDRYCSERYMPVAGGRTMMSVTAVSAEVRDHFLALWPENPARRKTAVITGHHLIGWHPFPRLYVGLATYEEHHERTWTVEEYLVWVEQYRQRWDRVERERSWWRCVPELQRFVPSPVNTTPAPGPGL